MIRVLRLTWPIGNCMDGLWRILTVAALIAHLWVGCCAHHAHACEGTVHSDQGDSPSDQGHDADHGDCPGDRAGHAYHHGQHGTHGCQESPCSFVLPSPPPQGSKPCDQGLHGSYLPVPDVQPCVAGDFGEARSQLSERFSLQVRLHLANQVLLI